MRLIDADALIHELNNSHYPGAPYVDAGISIAIGKVCDAPTIDPERKKGKWIRKIKRGVFGKFSISYECDRCHKVSVRKYSYCPNCGARTEGIIGCD